jgi:hypothetical protein
MFGRSRYPPPQVWRAIRRVVFTTFAAVLPELRASWKRLLGRGGASAAAAAATLAAGGAAPPPPPRPMLPRIAGVDVHLDSSLRPWLLEVRARTGLAIASTDRDLPTFSAFFPRAGLRCGARGREGAATLN